LLSTITNTTITTISIIALTIGIALILKFGNSKKVEKEVPIYKDKEIVGYRRH